MKILIVNGTAFATTQFDETIAFNVANGNVLWTFFTPLAPDQTLGEGTGPVPLHSHDGNEWFSTATFGAGVSGPTLWWQGQNNRVYAINAISGKEELNFSDFTGPSMVAGNSPQSFYNGIGASNIVINQQLGILVSSHDAEIDAANGRGFFAGWNLNTNPPSMKWITFSTPPQPNSGVPLNPYFDQQMIANMSAAATFYPGENGSTNGYTTPTELRGGVLMNTNDDIVVNWKTMSPTLLNQSLYNDWGQSDQTQQCLAIDGGGSTGSTGAGWGGPWLLGSGQSAGLVFLSTNNKDPFTGPCNPGPDLWSASVLALNVSTGAWMWGFQTTSHDIWDYDCAWYQTLANETVNGVNTEVVLKTCKDGYIFELNAVTGHLIWAWSPPAGTETSGSSHCPVCYPFNPLNSTMMNADFPSAITNCKSAPTIACLRGSQPPFLQWPSLLAGFGAESAYDPATNIFYGAAHVVPMYLGYFGLDGSTYYTSPGEGGVPCPTCGILSNNATIYAVDANNGTLKWYHKFGIDQGYRGSVQVSGNLVFATMSSGDVQMLDATSGHVVRNYYIGAPMDEGLSIGASITGQEYALVSVGTCGFAAVSTCPGTTPGDVVALSLVTPPPISPPTTVTTTSTAVSTTTATVTSVSTSVSTSSSTSSNSTLLYGVAAVAVIFIIATGYLTMTRSKKSPS